MDDSVYLCAPGYSHGTLTPIGALAELRREPDLLQTLEALGLETFALADRPLVEMAAEAAERVLVDCDLPPEQVEAIIYASSLYALGPEGYRADHAARWLESLAQRLGTSRAVPYGVSFGQCANIVHAIELARSLLQAGRTNVLIVTADQMHPSLSRIVEPGISVVSDVASAVLLSRRRLSPAVFGLGPTVTHVDWGLLNVSSKDDFPEYLRRTVEGMKVVAAQLYRHTNLGAPSVTQLITNTVNRSVCRIFSQATGVPTARIWSAAVSRLAHCDVADVVVNLSDFARGMQRVSGTPVLMIANGPHLWGGTMLTPC